MAQLGHGEMSELSSGFGVKRKSDFGSVRSAFDPFRKSRMMRPRHRLRLRAAITVEVRPDASEGAQRAVVVEREPDDILFFVSGFGSGAYSAKLLTGTRQRFSGFSQPRQCGRGFQSRRHGSSRRGRHHDHGA